MKQRILIVEDEPQLVGILEYLLKDEGFEALSAYTGEEALKLIKLEKPDLVIMDIMLPKMDGFELCMRIRRFTTIPVIILTAKKEQEDVIRGLEFGADDYLTKPFNHKELILRIKKILRRTAAYEVSRNIVLGDLEINPFSREVMVSKRRISLSPTEFNLLLCLVKNSGRVLSWESLLIEVWGYEDWIGGKELVKVNIRRLRKKLEPDPSKPVYIISIWGIGYKIASLSPRH
ncbi:MAG: response regulator transcription factor [Spirochaetota bacterium]